MGRSPCCAKEGLNKGAWTAAEDKILTEYIKVHGDGKWRSLPKAAGLKRCGKSCRLRWLNYLRPDIKRGNLTQDEEDLIIRLHRLLGNRWSLIAGRLPGRTDNEIKNYWNTKLSKKAQAEQSNPCKFGKKSITRTCNEAPIKVFRTTAMRLMTHQVQGLHQLVNTQPKNPKIHNVLETPSPMDANLEHYDSPVESKSTGGTSFSFLSKEENSSECMMMSFNVGEISLSEILDFDDFCDVNNVIKGDTNPDESDTGLLPSFSDQSHNLLNEELMPENWNCDGFIKANMDSNLGSSASFLETGDDWMI